ncbi:MAG: UDP-N-acetylglucosamine--N-acetylmuramyl-(pentapeptide) pyrophosphoryl-undecaprenol N-acetylglucosamine transferase [Planctomycetales bacterium]
MNEQRHIVFAGGGSGSHLYPGFATALHLQAQDPRTRITFAVEGGAFEKTQVRAHGFSCVEIPAEPLPKAPSRMWRFVARNWKGYREATRFLDAQRVSAVVGLGGYRSLPMARAASAKNIPLILLEPNAVPGRATRAVASKATILCAGFPQVLKHLPIGCSVQLTGTPVRPEIAALRLTPNSRRSTAAKGNDRQRGLLVLGGAQGSDALNRAAPYALYHLRSHLQGWHILHQAGPQEVQPTRELYRKFGLDATVTPFVKAMGSALRRIDAAVCRSGGSLLGELACAGIPSVLVPDPAAENDHQRINAECQAEWGGCDVCDSGDESQRFDYELARSISPLVSDETIRMRRAEATSRSAQPHAAHLVAMVVKKYGLPETVRNAA